MIVAGLIVAAVALLFQIQLLAQYLQRFNTDLRSAGPLVEIRPAAVPSIQPPDLDRLERLVADALVSDTYVDRELVPLLEQLRETAPTEVPELERPSRMGRSAWLNRSLDSLEWAWQRKK